MPRSPSTSCCTPRAPPHRTRWFTANTPWPDLDRPIILRTAEVSATTQPRPGAGNGRRAGARRPPSAPLFESQAMLDSTITVPADLRRDLTVTSVRSTIVDVPTVRHHKLSQTCVTVQSYLIVELRLANGAVGIGEAATLGG